MKLYIILAIGFVGIVLIATINVSSNEVYGSSKSGGFVQQNYFTVTEVKDGLMKIDGWSSSELVGNKTLSVILEFENGSKISYNDVKTLGVDFGQGFLRNNSAIEPTLSGGIVDNGFVQNNNITVGGGDQVGNNEDQTISINTFGDEGYSGFIQKI